MNIEYLTFRLHNIQYGIEAVLVQEIFPLPELTPLPVAATNIIGVLNFRGIMIPIMHLDLVQEYPDQGCNLNDSVIVVHWEGLQFGMIFNQVNEVLNLNAEAVEAEGCSEKLSNINPSLITEATKGYLGNIILLDPKILIDQLDAVLPLIWDAQMQLDERIASPKDEIKEQDEELQESEIIASFYDLYCPNITPEERSIFRHRANELTLPIESLKIQNKLIPIAIIGLGDEYFGLDLGLVRGFIDISNLTPIPCCPNHIVGNMNLRGEIITLVDIRKALSIPVSPISIGSQAVVVQVDDIVAGLPVERVLDMVELNSVDLNSSPTVPSALNLQYLQGTTFFKGKMLSVLDLPKIFTKGGIAVDEEV